MLLFYSGANIRRATSPDVRFQLSTDGLQAYVTAVDEMLLDRCDYGQLVKTYAQPEENERRYSPADCTGAVKVVVSGNLRGHLRSGQRGTLQIRPTEMADLGGHSATPAQTLGLVHGLRGVVAILAQKR